MALNCGILGLPNVGKSTIFSALCGVVTETTKYPSSTVKANVGVVNVPDERLNKLSAIFSPKKTIAATVEFVDIAGLVKGASRGEGLGNQFLSHLRDAAVYVHVVRCFEDSEIIHVNEAIDPVSDMETIDIELALADIQTLAKRRERAEKSLKNPSEKKLGEMVLSVLDKISPVLEEGGAIRSLNLSGEEKAAIYDCHFITEKPQVYVCNVDEETMRNITKGEMTNSRVATVLKRAEKEHTQAVCICGKFEAELSTLENDEEKKAFLEELGLEQTSLGTMIRCVYNKLGLRTFFTTGPDECRAWTIKAGGTALVAAGVIHTDFQKGFIKADVYTCDDIFTYETEVKIKSAGLYRLEGKDYIVKDGDVMFFKFNL